MKGKIIDLSHPIFHQMEVFPTDPPVGILKHHQLDLIGYNVAQVIMGTHTGTHLDAPFHRVSNGASVDEISLERFIGEAVVIDLTPIQSGEAIKLDNIRKYEKYIGNYKKVILKTDWSKRFGQRDYFSQFPYISEEVAEWMSSQNIDLIGLETPSVHPTDHLRIHDYFLRKGIIVVENLNNLYQISKRVVLFFAVPLKFRGLDGSPVRAFAIEDYKE